MMITGEALVNDFAIRSFRDIADGDYIVARMACRSVLVTQYLWASQQAIEKYLKCILLLNRIPACEVKHDLGAALSKVNNSGKLALNLTAATKKFIEYLDAYGRFRYLEISQHAFDADIVSLDRAVWELRRYCDLRDLREPMKLQKGVSPLKSVWSAGTLRRSSTTSRTPHANLCFGKMPSSEGGQGKWSGFHGDSMQPIHLCLCTRKFLTKW
ncbi:MAG: HEPN domain-containing protein [Terriglobia bacterium]